MARIINRGLIVDDTWSVVTNDDQAVSAAGGKLLLPLAAWQKSPPPTADCPRPGVWLAPDDDLAPLLPHLPVIPAIAIHFPSFTDGRGYSLARLLRQRHGFTGELRAFGDILRDQIYFLHRCGFDVFCLRADQDIDEALAALADYTWSPIAGQ